MIVRANNAGEMAVYFNTEQIINIHQVEENLYNVYFVEDKSVQIDGQTLRKIERGV